MKKLIFILCIALMAGPAAHSEETNFLYSQTIIKIVPKRPPEIQSDTLDAKPKKIEESSIKPALILPQLARVPKEFTMEIRPYALLKQRDFFVQRPFNEKAGMLIVFDPPQVATLSRANILSKVDVLFVLPDGVIDKIVPAVSLRDLQESISTEKQVKAWIFLNVGAVQANDILPGDRVEGNFFSTHTKILQ